MKGFSSWINESVQVSVKDYEPPENLFRNTYELSQHLTQLLMPIPGFNQGTNSELLTIDGLDTRAKRGILNLYTQGIPHESIPKILKGIKYYLDSFHIKHGEFKHDKSNLFTGEDVIRIPIFSMPEAGQRAPEVSMSNDVGNVIFRELLNMNINVNDHEVSARELLWKLQSISNTSVNKNTTKPKKINNFIDGGISEERLQRQINDLIALAQWAINNDYDTIQLS